MATEMVLLFIAGFIFGAGACWMFHRETTGILKDQNRSLDAERKTFMDQLAIIASGRPIFGQPAAVEDKQPEQPEFVEPPMTSEEAEAMVMRAARSSPTRLVAQANRVMRRKHEESYARHGTLVERQVQAVADDLDAAEAKGRQA